LLNCLISTSFRLFAAPQKKKSETSKERRQLKRQPTPAGMAVDDLAVTAAVQA